jgi:hypothetical protein
MQHTATPVHHPDLAQLFATHRHLRPRAPIFVWQGDDGTEALVFGRTIVAAAPGGPLRDAPTTSFHADRGRHVPSMEDVVRDLVRRPGGDARRPGAAWEAAGTRASTDQIGAVVTAIRAMESHGYAAAGDADRMQAHYEGTPPSLSALRALVNDLRRLVPVEAHRCRDQLAALYLDLPHLGASPLRHARR